MECDPVYNTTYHLTLRGWLECSQQVLRITRHFWGAWNELSIEAGLLLKGTRVSIPLELFDGTPADLHGPHQGIDKMQAHAREAMYRPSFDASIVDCVCQCTIALNTKPLLLHNLCYLWISPMAHGRRLLPITSPTRVKRTCSSAIFSASTPYTRYQLCLPIPYLNACRSSSCSMDCLVCFTPTVALHSCLMSSPNFYRAII